MESCLLHYTYYRTAFCNANMTIQAAVLQNMHEQVLQETGDGRKVIQDFIRVVFRKENF